MSARLLILLFLAAAMQWAGASRNLLAQVVGDSAAAASTSAENPTAPAGTNSAAASAKPSLKKATLDPALELVDPRTYRLKIVIRVDATDGVASNVAVVGPIPMEWPEQRLRLLSETVTPNAKVLESVLKGQAAMLKLTAATIAKGGHASVERLYEITRYRTQFTIPGEELKYSKSVPYDLREQLTSAAPGLEMTHPKMIELAKTLKLDEATAWDAHKHIWQWTRDNVKFENGDFRGALYAI